MCTSHINKDCYVRVKSTEIILYQYWMFIIHGTSYFLSPIYSIAIFPRLTYKMGLSDRNCISEQKLAQLSSTKFSLWIHTNECVMYFYSSFCYVLIFFCSEWYFFAKLIGDHVTCMENGKSRFRSSRIKILLYECLVSDLRVTETSYVHTQYKNIMILYLFRRRDEKLGWGFHFNLSWFPLFIHIVDSVRLR